MNTLLLYFGLAFLIGLLSLAIMINFARNRFEGDLTHFFIALFLALFGGSLVLSVIFINVMNTTVGS